jgi:protoheme IX farnesyltransferase
LVFFACWPVRASESRTGQTNSSAADGDEHLRKQGHKGDASIGPRGESRQTHRDDGTGADGNSPNLSSGRGTDSKRRLRTTRLSDPGPPALASASMESVAHPPLAARLRGYIALTKPRIIELLLITTVPTMIVAERGLPSWWLMIATVIGGTGAAGGANAINMFVDRDIDALMRRTRNRPLVTGLIAPRNALIFAIGLEAVAFFWLWFFVNLLSAVLAVAACLFYVFIYTLWLKRTSTSNIVIGGAAGAAPVLIGWSAVTDSLAWPPFLLFAIIFFWTPPHFWALAIRYEEDYTAADVPMLPSVVSRHETAVRILVYTLIVWALTIVFIPVGEMGWIYGVLAVGLGGFFTYLSVQLLRDPTTARAMRLFTFSITWVTLLFSGMALDELVRSGL